MIDEPPRQEIVTIALAEFAALRAEIDQKHQTQATLLSLNITLSAGVVGLVLSEKAPVALLVTIPLASSAITLLTRQQLMIANILGSYIRERIHPLLVEATGDKRVFRFEHYYWRQFVRKRSWFIHPVLDRLLMPTASLVILMLLLGHLHGAVQWFAWGLGMTAVAAQLGEGVVSLRGLGQSHRTALRKRPEP